MTFKSKLIITFTFLFVLITFVSTSKTVGAQTPGSFQCAYESFVVGPAPTCTKALEGNTQYGSRCSCTVATTGPVSSSVTSPSATPTTAELLKRIEELLKIVQELQRLVTGIQSQGQATNPANPTTPTAPVCAYEGFVVGPAPACTKALEGNTQYGSRCSCTASVGPTSSLVPSSSTIVFKAGPSYIGPWTENASMCSERDLYTLITGVDKNNPPKGCTTLSTRNDCLNLANHRDFNVRTEWSGLSSIVTAVGGGLLQNGSYDSYLSYPDGKIFKVGSFQLKQCNPSTTPTAPVCAYEGFVVGPAPTCTKALEGNTQYGSRCSCTVATTGPISSVVQPPSTLVPPTTTNSIQGQAYSAISKLKNLVADMTARLANEQNSPSRALIQSVIRNGNTSLLVAERSYNQSYFYSALSSAQSSITEIEQLQKRIGGQASQTSPSSSPTPPTPSTSPQPSPTLSNVRFEVANTPNGPWYQNASLCNDVGQKIYTQISGVSKTNPPRGCSDLSTRSACLSTGVHRAFTDAEWTSANTIRTMIDGGLLENGSFNSYISYPASGSAIKVGSFVLRQCTTPTTPVATPQCAYEGFVRGPAPICTHALEGNTEYGSRCSCTTTTTSPTSSSGTQPRAVNQLY